MIPERRPAALELAALREAIPAVARAKLVDVDSLKDAWKVLDMDYGDIQVIRVKLKDQVRSLKLKAVGDSAKIVELYSSIQTIASKIKVSGSMDLLEKDEEYIALVSKHLP